MMRRSADRQPIVAQAKVLDDTVGFWPGGHPSTWRSMATTSGTYAPSIDGAFFPKRRDIEQRRSGLLREMGILGIGLSDQSRLAPAALLRLQKARETLDQLPIARVERADHRHEA